MLDAIALGRKRLLLVMATGTGKTCTAFQIVNNLMKNHIARKILYLADRNELANHHPSNDFKPLEKVAHKVQYLKDRSTHVTAYEMYFAIYQQLIWDNGEKRYAELFRPGFFDEGQQKPTHNGRNPRIFFISNSNRNDRTTHGTKYAFNTHYFGEPIYSYSLNQGINDGFLVPFHVIDVRMNISNGWRPEPGQCDIYLE